jgi:hypothetical protein
MDIQTIVNGVKQLVRRVDFIDFANGNFRSRIQAGTLTADRTLTAPDATGTIALQTARSTSIQNLGAGMPIFASAAPDSAASIATGAQIRAAAGIETTLPGEPWAPKGLYIVADRARQSNSPVFRSLVDRFADIHLWGTVAYSGGANDAPFRTDGSATTIAAGQLAVWEIDFAPLYPWTANGLNGMIYVEGRIVVSSPYSSGFPDSVIVEFLARNVTTGLDEWFTAGTLTGFVAYTSKHLRISGVGYNHLKRIRISAQGRSGGNSWINKFEYYPDGPNANEQTYYVGRSGGNIFAPVAVRNAAETSVTTIGPGTIRINTGATLNWQSPVTTVTLTGEATQLITVAVPGATGIFVEATNARITGEVTGTGANNVTIHNPALLTGSVSLVLERYV